MCALCEIHNCTFYGLCISVYSYISAKVSKEKGRIYSDVAYSYFIFTINYKLEKKEELVCRIQKKTEKGKKTRNQRYRKQQNRDTKESRDYILSHYCDEIKFCN